MNMKLKLTKKEDQLIKNGNKTIIIRPNGGKFGKISKGDTINCDGLKLLVLDVRRYPKISALLQIEKREWIPLDSKEFVDVFSECIEDFKEAHENGEEFLAIEFSIQK